MTRPIEEAWLPRGHQFALEYKEGLVFLSIDSIEDTKFKPFEQLEDITGSSSLSGGYQRLNDVNGDDVIYVDKSTDPFVVIHVGIGQRPSFIRRFTRYPEGGGVSRTIPNLQTVSVSDTREYVDGVDSPYEQPTDAEELVIPPGQHVSFNFYNPDSDDHFPILNIKMRKYKVDVIDPTGTTEEKRVVWGIVKPGSNRERFPVGTFDDQETFNLESEWGVTPMPIEKAREVVQQ